MIIDEPPDQEGKEIKELYALYGSAMFISQCIERKLAICLATIYGPGPRKITRVQYDDLLDSLYQKTFGGLVKILKRVGDVPKQLVVDLEEAVKERNWLTHRFFYEKIAKFFSEKGRESISVELKQIGSFFEDLDLRLKAVLSKWGKEHGVTEEDHEKAMEEILREGKAPYT
jgi:hypothetical protein